ncbi:hypothetical protein [Arthrobacter sp. Marseille-P9274]|uniref:hypothetical protein n=1 Tax=Arthrobacter sp. Marseille-P9274 TaxID=2866572 RepID=UPI0021CA53A5|nr:hypothetical protein [Arthrobacter sp. Marseille-P9274]
MTPSDRRWKLIGRGAVLGLAIGSITGSLLAGLSEIFFDTDVPPLPYFIGGAVVGGLLGLCSGFLAAVLSLIAESFSRRWRQALRKAATGLAAFIGTLLPFTLFGPTVFVDLQSWWMTAVIWGAGWAAIPLSQRYLRRYPIRPAM